MTGSDRLTPTFKYFRELAWIVNGLPSPTLHFGRVRSRVLVPPPVVPKNEPIGIGHPAERWDILSEGFKLKIIDLHAWKLSELVNTRILRFPNEAE